MTHALRRVDFQLLAVVLLLCIIGAVAIYSCTRSETRPISRLTMQIAYIIVGMAAMFSMMLVDTGRLRNLAWPIYLVVMGLLVLVLMMGAIRDTNRWIPLGPVNLQPSELAKLAVIIMLGAVVARLEEEKWDFLFLVKTLGYIALPALLILVQPDLGTPIVLFFIWMAMMFVLGASPIHIAAFALAGVMLFAGAWGFGLIKPHQRARLTSFMNPDDAPLDAAYHLRQSLIAVGAGHLWGQGLFHGAQSQADFIPDQHTDFIFTVIAEELGFVGAFSVLVLFGLLLYRGLCICAYSPTTFDRVVAGGIVAMLLIQVYVNVAMTIGLAPVKGMALPFLSYGGSSLLVNMMAMGILQSIHMRREQIVF
ncbi:MAG: rod shape-determining protein RodA [candidate division WS1 bacterium]|nr:rod shape-determining protein RodA [candidate division WS1 bacterium]